MPAEFVLDDLAFGPLLDKPAGRSCMHGERRDRGWLRLDVSTGEFSVDPCDLPFQPDELFCGIEHGRLRLLFAQYNWFRLLSLRWFSCRVIGYSYCFRR